MACLQVVKKWDCCNQQPRPAAHFHSGTSGALKLLAVMLSLFMAVPCVQLAAPELRTAALPMFHYSILSLRVPLNTFTAGATDADAAAGATASAAAAAAGTASTH
jgi:hypothetical protein